MDSLITNSPQAEVEALASLDRPSLLPRAAPPKRHQLKHVRSHHREILRRTALGMRPKDIAPELGVSTGTVRAVVSSELGKEQLAALQCAQDLDTMDMSKHIQDLAGQAVEVLEQVIDGTVKATTALKVKVAQDLLDRGGLGRHIKVDSGGGYLKERGMQKIHETAQRLGIKVVQNGVEIQAVVESPE